MQKKYKLYTVDGMKPGLYRTGKSKTGESMKVERVNLKQKVDSIPELFRYLKVGQLNDHMLNVLQAENRTLDFHVHPDSDEMFYVIEGSFQIELDDGLIDLHEGDFIIIPKGVRHRPVCRELVKCLLIEKVGTLNRDNTGGTYTE